MRDWLYNPLLGNRPMVYAGMDITLVSAQHQQRTPRDVPVGWVRPRCPAKLKGRKGTRKGWKRQRAHWPHMEFAYREPTDVLMIGNRVIATERQYQAIKRQAETGGS